MGRPSTADRGRHPLAPSPTRRGGTTATGVPLGPAAPFPRRRGGRGPRERASPTAAVPPCSVAGTRKHGDAEMPRGRATDMDCKSTPTGRSCISSIRSRVNGCLATRRPSRSRWRSTGAPRTSAGARRMSAAVLKPRRRNSLACTLSWRGCGARGRRQRSGPCSRQAASAGRARARRGRRSRPTGAQGRLPTGGGAGVRDRTAGHQWTWQREHASG